MIEELQKLKVKEVHYLKRILLNIEQEKIAKDMFEQKIIKNDKAV